jgi:hypothetical protein
MIPCIRRPDYVPGVYCTLCDDVRVLAPVASLRTKQAPALGDFGYLDGMFDTMTESEFTIFAELDGVFDNDWMTMLQKSFKWLIPSPSRRR